MGQSFRIDLLTGLFLKLNANWMFDEGHYESFNKDYLNTRAPGTAAVTRRLSLTGPCDRHTTPFLITTLPLARVIP
jgi:hypothetical protein